MVQLYTLMTEIVSGVSKLGNDLEPVSSKGVNVYVTKFLHKFPTRTMFYRQKNQGDVGLQHTKYVRANGK